MTPDELLQVFHRQIRLTNADSVPGWVRDQVGRVRRSYPADPRAGGRGFVEGPEGLGDDPDAVIAEQRDFFAARGQQVEWKTYGYDQPADLGERLAVAGFVSEGPETLILGAVESILAEPTALPSKIRIRDVSQPRDFERIAALHSEVFGWDNEWVNAVLAAEQRKYPDRLVVSLVEEALAGPDGPALTAGWLRFHPGTEFASLWGGGTRAEWRRRGLYRALLRHRAELAQARGYRYLRVDASADSRPILQRLGLHAVATTTPYLLTP